MDKPGLTYNTERKQITISEYGRNIQEMIQKLSEIDDKKVRSEAANFIIGVMAQMNPQVKENNDWQHKLWDHLYIIAGPELDIDSPFEPPVMETQQNTPQHIGYQTNNIQYGHYGQYIVKMIEAAAKEEDDEVRLVLAYSIANQMKRNYLSWNKNVVNDQVIVEDLKRISEGRLVLPEDAKLSTSGEISNKPQQQQKSQQGKKKKKKVPNLKANMNNPNNPAYKKKSN